MPGTKGDATLSGQYSVFLSALCFPVSTLFSCRHSVFLSVLCFPVSTTLKSTIDPRQLEEPHRQDTSYLFVFVKFVA